MPGSNRRPTACKADVITTTLELRRKKASPIQQFLQGCSHRAHSSVRAGRFFAYESPNLGFWAALLARHGSVFASTPSQTRCQHCLQPLLAGVLVARALRPESQHALPCSQAHKSPRGADTATSAADTPRSTAARASTGAQHHRTTNKKRSPPPRPRALRRALSIPIGERRRRTLPLHQRRRGRIKRLRVLQLDGQ